MKHLFNAFILFWAIVASQATNAQTTEQKRIVELVNKWNDAHNTQNLTELSGLYADTVLFYGMNIAGSECLVKLKSVLKKYKSYNQQVEGDIKLVEMIDGEQLASFIKNVTVNGKLKEYPSYLVYKMQGSKWVITEESDGVTDKNLVAKKQKAGSNIGEKILGDYDGDGKKEYMWLEKPEVLDMYECKGGCNSYIRFSNPKIPSIEKKNCLDGVLVNHGDLNDDGKDEIGLLPFWFTSNWSAYFVWTLKDGNWVYAVDPIPTFGNPWEDGMSPIEKDKKHAGNVIVRYTEMKDDNMGMKVKSVRIKK